MQTYCYKCGIDRDVDIEFFWEKFYKDSTKRITITGYASCVYCNSPLGKCDVIGTMVFTSRKQAMFRSVK